MLRFATIGTSSIVELFATAVQQLPDVELTVVHSRDRERAQSFAATVGARRAVTSLSELAGATDVDAVYVASPNALHFEQASALVVAGKHVLVEKSACANAAQWEGLLQLAHEHGVVVLESVRAVHDPSWRMITAHLDSLGPLRSVELHLAQRSRRYDNFLAGRVENIFRPEMAAGALMDLGVYCLHPLVTLLGAPQRVRASSVLLRNGIDGTTSLLLDYPGLVAGVTASKISVDRRPSMFAGEDASLFVDAVDAPRMLQMCFAGKECEELAVERPLPQQAYVVQAFARMLEDPALAAPHQLATSRALAVMDEARRQVGLVFPADQEPVGR